MNFPQKYPFIDDLPQKSPFLDVFPQKRPFVDPSCSSWGGRRQAHNPAASKPTRLNPRFK